MARPGEQHDMMTAIALSLAPIQIAAPTPAPPPAAAAPVETVVSQRDWIGTLTVPSGVTLRIAVHIATGADGALAGTLDSLDQNANGTRLARIERSATTLRFDVPDNGGRYAGRWNAATGSWTGTWYQSGLELPLVLKAGGPPPARKVPVHEARPQTTIHTVKCVCRISQLHTSLQRESPR